jgi:translation initiation factor 1A
VGLRAEEEEKLYKPEGTEEVIRVRIPDKRRREVLAIVEKMLGGRRAGRLKRRHWVNVGDAVIIVPWDFQDEKADLIYRYRRPQMEWLRRKGYLK